MLSKWLLALQGTPGSLAGCLCGPSPRSSQAPPELSTGGLLGHPPSFSSSGTSHGISMNKTKRCCWHPEGKTQGHCYTPTEPGASQRECPVSIVWWSRSPGPALQLCFCLLCNLELPVPRPPFSHLHTGLVEVKLVPGQVCGFREVVRGQYRVVPQEALAVIAPSICLSARLPISSATGRGGPDFKPAGPHVVSFHTPGCVAFRATGGNRFLFTGCLWVP